MQLSPPTDPSLDPTAVRDTPVFRKQILLFMLVTVLFFLWGCRTT
jgi:hypothetical protein